MSLVRSWADNAHRRRPALLYRCPTSRKTALFTGFLVMDLIFDIVVDFPAVFLGRPLWKPTTMNREPIFVIPRLTSGTPDAKPN